MKNASLISYCRQTSSESNYFKSESVMDMNNSSWHTIYIEAKILTNEKAS